MNSKLYDAQDELKSLLIGAPDLAGVPKHLGTPIKLDTLREVVWISGEVEEWNQEYRVTGLQAKDESFTIKVHVLVTKSGDYEATRNRARALAAAVEETISANYTLNDTVELAQIRAGAVEEARLDDRQHQVLITLYINCRAWLTA